MAKKKAKPDNGMSEEQEVVEITVVLMDGGLRSQLLGDCSSALKKSGVVWSKQKGINGENDVYIHCPSVRLIEVTKGQIRRMDNPGGGQAAGFKPVDFPRG